MKVDPFIPVTKGRQAPVRRTSPTIRHTRPGRSIDGVVQSQPKSTPRPAVHNQQLPPRSTIQRPTRPTASPFIRPRESIPRSASDQSFQQATVPAQSSPPLPSRALDASIEQPAKRPVKSRFRKLLGLSLQIVILLTIFILGFLLRSLVVGQVLIIVYAVVAFLLKIESRTTFILALMSLGVVLIASLKADSGLASLFAVYAFLLLAVGTLCLGREVRDEI